MDNSLKFEDLGAIVRRRKLQIGIPVVVILLLSAVLAYMLPRIYVSTATILIEKQEIPRDLVTSTVTGYAAERIETVRSHVMTRDNLWAIAEKLDLYPEIRSPENQQDVLRRMRDNITINMITSEAVDPKNGRTVTPTIAFTVSYGNESPDLAQAVTAELAKLFIDEDRRSRTENAELASSFLMDEAKRLQKQISDLEARIADFKVKNADYLPESFKTSSRLLESAQDELERLAAKLSPLESRYAFLKKRLADFGASAQLAKARAELAAARQKYSDIYPDVIRLKQTVAALEAEVQRTGGAEVYGASVTDPEYLALQSEMQKVKGDIASIRAQRDELNQKIAEYKTRLAKSPQVEREYLMLTRDLDHATDNYREIMDKVTSAQLAEELERTHKGQRFTLIEAATYPTSPSKPNVPAIMLLGLTLALGVGVGSAALAEYMDHRIHGPKDIAAVFKAPPIAIIPEIQG